jgi:hypothetical protein
MKNHGILMWSRWSLTRKTAAMGALFGGLLWPGAALLGVVFSKPHEPFDWLDWVFVAVNCPAALLCRAFDWRLEEYNGQTGFSIVAITFIILTDAVLGLLGGTFLGWLLSIRKRAKH